MKLGFVIKTRPDFGLVLKILTFKGKKVITFVLYVIMTVAIKEKSFPASMHAHTCYAWRHDVTSGSDTICKTA